MPVYRYNLLARPFDADGNTVNDVRMCEFEAPSSQPMRDEEALAMFRARVSNRMEPVSTSVRSWLDGIPKGYTMSFNHTVDRQTTRRDAVVVLPSGAVTTTGIIDSVMLSEAASNARIVQTVGAVFSALSMRYQAPVIFTNLQSAGPSIRAPRLIRRVSSWGAQTFRLNRYISHVRVTPDGAAFFRGAPFDMRFNFYAYAVPSVAETLAVYREMVATASNLTAREKAYPANVVQTYIISGYDVGAGILTPYLEDGLQRVPGAPRWEAISHVLICTGLVGLPGDGAIYWGGEPESIRAQVTEEMENRANVTMTELGLTPAYSVTGGDVDEPMARATGHSAISATIGVLTSTISSNTAMITREDTTHRTSGTDGPGGHNVPRMAQEPHDMGYTGPGVGEGRSGLAAFVTVEVDPANLPNNAVPLAPAVPMVLSGTYRHHKDGEFLPFEVQVTVSPDRVNSTFIVNTVRNHLGSFVMSDTENLFGRTTLFRGTLAEWQAEKKRIYEEQQRDFEYRPRRPKRTFTDDLSLHEKEVIKRAGPAACRNCLAFHAHEYADTGSLPAIAKPRSGKCVPKLPPHFVRSDSSISNTIHDDMQVCHLHKWRD